MLFIENGSLDPFYNLALEETLLRSAREDILLLWRDDPCVISGCFQNICREADVCECCRLGIPVLRRISGGGTVYHDGGNVNYTFISEYGGRIDYGRFLAPVIGALRRLGVSAGPLGSSGIEADGKKVSGSAEKIMNGRVLHHGTLLFRTDIGLLDRLTAGAASSGFAGAGTRSSVHAAGNLCDLLPGIPDAQSLMTLLKEQLLPAGSRETIPDAATAAEARALSDSKYRSRGWIWGGTPVFSFENSGSFLGRPLAVRFRAEHGVLEEVSLETDALDSSAAAASLTGLSLDPAVLAPACREIAGSGGGELMRILYGR